MYINSAPVFNPPHYSSNQHNRANDRHSKKQPRTPSDSTSNVIGFAIARQCFGFIISQQALLKG